MVIRLIILHVVISDHAGHPRLSVHVGRNNGSNTVLLEVQACFWELLAQSVAGAISVKRCGR